MSATLLAIPDAPHTARRDALTRTVQTTGAALLATIEAGDPQTVRTALRAYDEAQDRLRAHWERQTKQAERRLRDLLSADLSAEQRASVMTALYGPVEGRRRNPHILTPYERHILDAYRAIDTGGKTLLRLFLDRLAGTSPAPA